MCGGNASVERRAPAAAAGFSSTGSTTGQPQSLYCRRHRQHPSSCLSKRSSQSPLSRCHAARVNSRSRAPLAFFLVSVSMAGRDRAAAGPLRPPTGVRCSSAGGGGPVGGPEQPGAGTATEGSRRDVSSSRPSCRSRRRSWRARPPVHALSAAAAPGSITLGESWRPPSSSRRY